MSAADQEQRTEPDQATEPAAATDPGRHVDHEHRKVTWFQRYAIKELRKAAGREDGEPLQPEDWQILWETHATGANRFVGRLFQRMPSSPRCGVCGAPFGNPGNLILRHLGYRPSRKNPTICNVCVEASPPGGMTMYAGILFADLRGFTSQMEGRSPHEASTVLRRFYRAAEDVLFPNALIDKLIGDEVMALYLPPLNRIGPEDTPELMLAHARELLRAVGYGTGKTPFVEMGIGLDVGEAFVGNIGQRALYDFTAIGDVVNTASRLQGQAAGGEVVMSDRVAAGLPASELGTPVALTLKGKAEPQPAYRVTVGV